MASEYLNQRVLKRVVERLRKYEKKKKLPKSISQTINYLLDNADNQRTLRKAILPPSLR